MAEKRERYIVDFKDIPSERRHMPELEVEKRKDNFEEVEAGLSTEEAQKEARRCLSCRRCLGCELCLAVCEPRAIVFEQEDEIIDLTVNDVIISPEVKRYIPLEKGEFGYGKYVNVVTAFEFERILCDNGPHGGVLMRPFDGEIPEKIAFILGDDLCGKKDNKTSNYFLSYALKEAALAVKKVKDLEISIFVSGTGESEEDSGKVRAGIPQLTVKKGTMLEIKEIEETKNLVIKFVEAGETKEEEYEMIILSAEPILSNEIREVSKKLGIEIDHGSFWEESVLH